MSSGETGEHDPTDLFGGLSDDESSKEEASEENTASPEGEGAAGGFLAQAASEAGDGAPPCADESGADGGACGGGGPLDQAAGAEEKEAAVGAAGNGGGSRPRKTLLLPAMGRLPVKFIACSPSRFVDIDTLRSIIEVPPSLQPAAAAKAFFYEADQPARILITLAVPAGSKVDHFRANTVGPYSNNKVFLRVYAGHHHALPPRGGVPPLIPDKQYVKECVGDLYYAEMRGRRSYPP